VLIGLAGGLSYWKNIRIDRRKLGDFESRHGKHSVADDRDEQQAETLTALRPCLSEPHPASVQQTRPRESRNNPQRSRFASFGWTRL
jgi:hypothetical protein